MRIDGFQCDTCGKIEQLKDTAFPEGWFMLTYRNLNILPPKHFCCMSHVKEYSENFLMGKESVLDSKTKEVLDSKNPQRPRFEWKEPDLDSKTAIIPSQKG